MKSGSRIEYIVVRRFNSDAKNGSFGKEMIKTPLPFSRCHKSQKCDHITETDQVKSKVQPKGETENELNVLKI